MILRLVAPAIVLAMLAPDVLSDTLILRNGNRIYGAVSEKAALHMNPLGLREISIRVAKAVDGRPRTLRFDIDEVEMIILDKNNAREFIDFSDLRRKQYAATTPVEPEAGPIGDGDASEGPEPLLDPTGELKRYGPEAGGEYQPHTTRIVESDKLLLGVGIVTLGLGAAVRFGEERVAPDTGREMGAANYGLIVGGAALATYGLVKILSRGEPSDEGHLEIDPRVDGFHIGKRWRF